MKKVTVLEPIHSAGINILRKHAEVTILSGPNDPERDRPLANADAIIVRSTTIGREIMDLAPQLKVIGRHGAGIDNIDLATAKSRGITVVNTPHSNTESVAEYSIAALFSLFRRLKGTETALRSGVFTPQNGSLPGQVDRMGLMGRDIRGSHLGIIGAGAIGQAVARRAIALGMKVTAFDPFVVESQLAGSNINLVANIDELLSSVDAVSIHIPGGQEPVIGVRELALLKPTAFVVNAARGGVVDEMALAQALRDGRLAGAAVDVFSTEPPEKNHPLFTAPNIIVTPHVAAMTGQALERMAIDVASFTLDALNIPHDESRK